MAKTEEELSSKSLFREKLFACDMGWAKKIVGVSQTFFKAFRYIKEHALLSARATCRERRRRHPNDKSSANFCCATARDARERKRERERESSFFGWHMTTEFLSHSLNDDDFDSRAKKKTPRVCRRQRRDKKKPKKAASRDIKIEMHCLQQGLEEHYSISRPGR